MSDEIQVVNPFLKPMAERINAGAVAIEADRAVAEAQGRLVIAKKFPRNKAVAFDQIMEECKRPGLAEEALYSFPRGGETVEGPSIRLAEVIARCWGNVDFGLRELSRRSGESEMEAYAWDLETNTRSVQQFTVGHFRDTRKGGKVALTDERDIYEIGANLGARRLRARILAIVPGDVIDAAVAQCRRTLAGKNDEPLADRVRKMIAAFKGIGVTVGMIEQRIGRPLDAMTPEELRQMQGAFKSIRDGMTKVEDWFASTQSEVGQPRHNAAASLREMASESTKKPAPANTEQPEDPSPLADLKTDLAKCDSAEAVQATQNVWLKQSDESLHGEIKAMCKERAKAFWK